MRRNGQRICRDLPLAECRLKFLGPSNDPAAPVTFEGYASVWGRVDSYGDTVVQGAFTKALKARSPMMFFGHSPGRVIGKWVGASEDDYGLKVAGELTPNHSEASDVAASLKHGALNGLSIGGYYGDATEIKDGAATIREFDLFEVSVVSLPAEDAARIDVASVKSMLDGCDTIRDLEHLLRDVAGFSGSAATATVAKMQKIVRGELGRAAAKEQVLAMLRDLHPA